MAGVVIAVAGVVGTRVPRALEHGWLDAVPVILLRPALWWERDTARELCDNQLEPFRARVLLSQWQRLLVASELDRRLASPFDSQQRLRLRHAFEVDRLSVLLPQLGREGRVATPVHSAVRDHSDSLSSMKSLTMSGAADCRPELLMRAREFRHRQEASEAALALVDIGLATGSPPAITLVDLLTCQSQELLGKSMQRCGAEGTANAYAMELAGLILGHPMAGVRELGLANLMSWSGDIDWARPYLDASWNERRAGDASFVLVFLVSRLTNPRDKRMPRMALICDQEGGRLADDARDLLLTWLSSDEDSHARLLDSLYQLDRMSPRPDGRPREPAEWLCEVSFTNLRAGAEPKLEPLRRGLSPAEFAQAIRFELPKYVDEQIVCRAVTLLGSSLGPDESADFFLAMLDRYPTTIMHCVLLASIAEPQAAHPATRPMIVAALKDTRIPVLINACLAAAKMNGPDPEVVVLLDPLTRHTNGSVVWSANAAIKKLRNEADGVESRIEAEPK